MSERYIWIAGLILAGFVIQNQSNNTDNFQFLLKTYETETQIQDSELRDLSNQMAIARDTSYSKGFEDGKTQAGIALAKGGSLYDYKDGYHAGISQQVEESDLLEVSTGIVNELTALRKMVPRLLDQNQKLEAKLNSPVDPNYAWNLLMENLEVEIDAETTYLEIIDLLTDSSQLDRALAPPPSSLAQED